MCGRSQFLGFSRRIFYAGQGILKFQFFFLNLSNEFPAGDRVRTSKYPYMDICGTQASPPPELLVLPHKPVQRGQSYRFNSKQ